MELLQKELNSQNTFIHYRIWDAIEDKQIPFRGISQSHKIVVRYAKKKNLPFVIIAEDDFHFTCADSWQYFLNNMPYDYDLYLSCIYFGTISPADNTVADFAGNTLYAVHNRYYDTFLGLDEINHLDRAHARKGRFVVCNPFVAKQCESYSDNSRCVQNYTKHLEGRKFYGED
jgi:hypothetical protein